MLQADNICYESKGDKYGQFNVLSTGVLTGIKLVHKSGGIQCCSECNNGLSSFGCSNPIYLKYIGIIIISVSRSEIIIPASDTQFQNYFYEHPGYNVSSNEIIFKRLNHPVTQGMVLKIWYAQDFLDSSEENNSGKHCVDVYATIV